MPVGLFYKTFRRTFQKSGKRSLLGGRSLAGSWRNQSSSLVGFMRLAALGKPIVAKKRRMLGGSELGRRFSYMGALTQWPFRVLGREGARIPALGEEEMCGR